jgi:peptide/nickel transport system substrate-binding protein
MRRLSLVILLAALLLTGCQGGFSPFVPSATPPPSPTPTATPEPRQLTICTTQEPDTLYLYGNPNQAALNVLSAVLEGPIFHNTQGAQPAILSTLPTMDNGDASLHPVDVQTGDEIANSTGDVVNLQAGATVFPSGCTSATCAAKWDGKSNLRLDQLTLRFHLLPGLKWSDGQPLTADDSVYSFELASDKDTPASKTLVEHTASYRALDAQTVEWTGKPGYLPKDFPAFFFTPLPRHAWQAISAKDLLSSPASARQPLGWGPYQMSAWASGQSLTLVKNPNYRGSAQGLPAFDQLVFRIVPADSQQALTDLQNGSCDLLDPSVPLLNRLDQLDPMQTAGQLKLFLGYGPEWEHLDFGITPAAYDNGYAPGLGDRPDFFGDVRVRQAVALCIDRQGLVKQLFAGKVPVSESYLPPGDPLIPSDLPALAFDPQRARSLLDEAGWRDTDNNEATPRVSQGVRYLANGTSLVLNYSTSQAPLREAIANIVRTDLAQCGIGVNINALDPQQLFAPGPDGVLFGRQFDLAEFGWAQSDQAPCYLYASTEIPNPSNHWMGLRYGGPNLTGYNNPTYDQACQQALQAGLDAAVYKQATGQTLSLLAEDVPTLPLFHQPKLLVARADFCPIQVNDPARPLQNVASFDYGPQCRGAGGNNP